MRSNKKSLAAFTLIELLIVIGILALLMGIVVVGINPGRQFAQTRNTQRWAHASAILSATYQNIVDNKGTFSCGAGAIPTTPTTMSNLGYNICDCLVSTYLASMPFDPSVSGANYTSCSSYNTGYTIQRDATTNRITISAPASELGETISLTK